MDATAGALIGGVGAAAGVAGVLYFAWLRPSKRSLEALRREAEQKAESIIHEAKQEITLARERFENEVKDKLAGLQRQEDRLCSRDEALESRRTQLQDRETALIQESRQLAEREDGIVKRLRAIEEELERVASLDRPKARELLMKKVEAEFREAAIRKGREIESKALEAAEKKARHVLLDVMQRNVVDYVTEATLAVVEIPNEEMKGRIIGREGRNIRSFEQVTGVDLIVDETPEAVVISCFDPVRRETARLALMNLMMDGRIHPGRIEELYDKAQEEVIRMVREAGEKAADRAGVHGLPPAVIEVMGRLRFRTSYAQNVLDHSVEVSRLAASLSAELGMNTEVARRAGFLHDIGKALGPEFSGPHALTGMEFLRSTDEKDSVLHAVGAHHHDIEPQSSEAIAVILADTISASRPGARRESLDNYIKRLSALESIANGFPGVERSYAVQAGREIRLMVKPMEIDDLGAVRLANDVAKRIENELEYPGQIKVTVIRETRFQQVAR